MLTLFLHHSNTYSHFPVVVSFQGVDSHNPSTIGNTYITPSLTSIGGTRPPPGGRKTDVVLPECVCSSMCSFPTMSRTTASQKGQRQPQPKAGNLKSNKGWFYFYIYLKYVHRILFMIQSF
jgi:hypothetical protein